MNNLFCNLKHTFDVPYNFDKKLVDFLYDFTKDNPELIYSFYLPPHDLHYKCAKPFLMRHHAGSRYTLDEYEDHIKYLESKFPGKSMLLIQHREELIDTKILKEFYIEKLHITKFCVGSLKQAQIIKEILPTAEIIGSICMKAEEPQFNDPEYKKVFNGFVLWFPFNRDIDRVSKLPKDFYYVLLVNCGCNIHCNGDYHWFRTDYTNFEFVCKKYPGFENNIYVRPEDLPEWDPYIKVYKLQGREYTTEKVIKDFIIFSDEYRETDQHKYIESNRKDYEKH